MNHKIQSTSNHAIEMNRRRSSRFWLAWEGGPVHHDQGGIHGRSPHRSRSMMVVSRYKPAFAVMASRCCSYALALLLFFCPTVTMADLNRSEGARCDAADGLWAKATLLANELGLGRRFTIILNRVSLQNEKEQCVAEEAIFDIGRFEYALRNDLFSGSASLERVQEGAFVPKKGPTFDSVVATDDWAFRYDARRKGWFKINRCTASTGADSLIREANNILTALRKSADRKRGGTGSPSGRCVFEQRWVDGTRTMIRRSGAGAQPGVLEVIDRKGETVVRRLWVGPTTNDLISVDSIIAPPAWRRPQEENE